MNATEMIPLPRPTPLSQPHWDGCRENRLLVQQCADCAAYIFIPQPRCSACQSKALNWVESSGQGTVYSYTIVHRPPRPQFDAPYAVAIIELEEGWFMLSNIVDCEPRDIGVGMAVKVAFRRMTEEITLPYYVRA